jgi:RNA polymerase sigma-70 factor (ECF subfamily)
MVDDAQTRFLKLHMAQQRPLYGFILAAVRDPVEADDLLQQVTLILWKKFEEFREGSPYLPWAFGIARYEIASHFRRQGRGERRVSMDILDQVAPELEAQEGRLERERGALAECVRTLPEPLRELLRLRYDEGTSLRELASRLGQSLAAVNMKIVRVRRALLDAARPRLAGEA